MDAPVSAPSALEAYGADSETYYGDVDYYYHQRPLLGNASAPALRRRSRRRRRADSLVDAISLSHVGFGSLLSLASSLPPPPDGGNAAAAAAARRRRKGLSEKHVAINLVKCLLGTGSFSLPHAFRQMGVVGGGLTLCVFGALDVYTMQLLVHAERRAVLATATNAAESDRYGRAPRRLTYPALVATLFAGVRGAAVASRLVALMIVLTSFGACAAYLLFIAKTMAAVARPRKTIVLNTQV